jgi:ParB family chromosome partitioning protein
VQKLLNDGILDCLPCDKLRDHPLRFQFYSNAHINSIVNSIQETGMIDAIVVRRENEQYTILSGHYRVRAIRQLKMKTVLCRILECDEKMALIAYCTSNIIGRRLNAIEEGHMINELMNKEHLSMEEVGKFWGHDKSWVSRRISLIEKLAPSVKKEVASGSLSPRIAQELTKLPRGNEQETAMKIMKKCGFGKNDATEFVWWWLSLPQDERIKKMESEGFFDEGKIILIKTNTTIKNCMTIINQMLVILSSSAIQQISWQNVKDFTNLRKSALRMCELLPEGREVSK